MPIYTLTRNLRTQRGEACELLAQLFQHVETMGLTLNAITITTTGGNNGRVQIDTTQTIPADRLAHLGFS